MCSAVLNALLYIFTEPVVIDKVSADDDLISDLKLDLRKKMNLNYEINKE